MTMIWAIGKRSFFFFLATFFLSLPSVLADTVLTPQTDSVVRLPVIITMAVIGAFFIILAVADGSFWAAAPGLVIFFIIGVIILKGNLGLPSGTIETINGSVTTTQVVYEAWVGSNNKLVGYCLSIVMGLAFAFGLLNEGPFGGD